MNQNDAEMCAHDVNDVDGDEDAELAVDCYADAVHAAAAAAVVDVIVDLTAAAADVTDCQCRIRLQVHLFRLVLVDVVAAVAAAAVRMRQRLPQLQPLLCCDAMLPRPLPLHPGHRLTIGLGLF